jgi:hypothetical protein
MHRWPVPSSSRQNKQACSAARCPISTWHSRLGHASNRVVEQIIRMHNLVILQKTMNNSICDACQQVKSHQLLYSNSMSSSKFPLELVYSDVWGPAPESIGRKNIMCLLLMITVNSPRFTCSNLNPRYFTSSKNFRLLLREGSTARF